GSVREAVLAKPAPISGIEIAIGKFQLLRAQLCERVTIALLGRDKAVEEQLLCFARRHLERKRPEWANFRQQFEDNTKETSPPFWLRVFVAVLLRVLLRRQAKHKARLLRLRRDLHDL